MKAIVPILQLSRKEEILDLSETYHSDVKDFGNGIFISNDGLILSVAHVLSSDLGTEPYALINNKFHRIKILKISLSKHPENFNDVAIGKITFNSTDFIDIAQFKCVEKDSNLLVIGYSRMMLRDDNEVFNYEKPELSLVKLSVSCHNEKYYDYYYEVTGTIHSLTNSFTVKAGHECFDGLSGSPVVNKTNQEEIFGILRGGKMLKNGKLLHVLQVDAFKDLL